MPAILGFLAAAGAFLDNTMVRRLLCNLAKSIHTPVIAGTEVDGWIIKIIYGAEAYPPDVRKEVIAAELNKAQETYTAIKTEAETTGDYTKLHQIKMVRPLDVEPLGDLPGA